MLFACFIIAAARFAAPLDREDVKVQFVRPSKVVGTIANLTTAELTADDLHGLILVEGNPDEIKQATTFINMFDVHRRRVSVTVTVESPLDKVTYQVSARLLNNQVWQSSDGDIGVTFSITPRRNDDNTVTLLVTYGMVKSRPRQVVVRVKAGASQTFSVGNDESEQTRSKPDGSIEIKSTPIPVPKITIRPEILD